MQGAVVRMARPIHKKDRVVKGDSFFPAQLTGAQCAYSLHVDGRRETPPSCKAYAHTMADYRAHSWPDGDTVS